MSTTLANCQIELSKQIADYWSSTTTSDGSTTPFITMIDSTLAAKPADWITDTTWVILTEEPAGGTTSLYDERQVSSLSSSTLTVNAFTERIVSGINYELHRLFSPSEKRQALVAAAQRVYPTLFTEIWDETLVSGNWLKDGSFERWTSASDLTDWAETTVTVTETATAGYVRHGATSAKLSGSAGTLVQGWKAGTAEFEDLRNLRGRSATFTIQAWADTASDLRISINDGTTQTYSEYHAGDDAWTEDNPRNDNIYVTQYIDPNATQVTFTIHWAGLGTASYVDDARVISDYRGKLYIGHLGLAQNRPHQVLMEPNYYSQQEDWIKLFDWKVDPDGYLYLPTVYPSDYRLRIRGIKILDFLASGVSSTLWTASIDLAQPQIEILVAQAALYLYTWMSMPNFESGTREDYQQMMGFWENELTKRKAQFGMRSPGATTMWGVH